MATLRYLNPLIVVADASRAQFFRVDADSNSAVEYMALVNGAAHLNDQDLTSDRPGRSFDSKGAGRHAMEVRTSAKDHATQSFAQEVAEALAEHLHKLGLEKLILIAAPRFLGMLRKTLPAAARAAVYAEVDNDLTTHSPEQITDAIKRKLDID